MSMTMASLEKRAQAISREIVQLRPAGPIPSAYEMACAAGVTPDPWQRRVLESEKRQFLLLASRQSGKSMTSALLALHEAVYHPGSLTLIVSPTERQSKLLLKTIRGFYYQLKDAPPPTAMGKLAIELSNGAEIVALPGDEENIRGYSDVDLILQDEAAIVPDELYESIRPMLAVSGGRLVLLTTPRGRRGHFYDEWTNGGETWHREKVIASECPRISPEFLAEERKRAGDYWYRQEYECEFVDLDTQYFASELIEGAISHDIVPLDLPGFGEWAA